MSTSGIASGSLLQGVLASGHVVPAWSMTVTWLTARGRRVVKTTLRPALDPLAEAQDVLASVAPDRVVSLVLSRVWMAVAVSAT